MQYVMSRDIGNIEVVVIMFIWKIKYTHMVTRVIVPYLELWYQGYRVIKDAADPKKFLNEGTNCSFYLTLTLWVMRRGMNDHDSHVFTGFLESNLELGAIISQYLLRYPFLTAFTINRRLSGSRHPIPYH